MTFSVAVSDPVPAFAIDARSWSVQGDGVILPVA